MPALRYLAICSAPASIRASIDAIFLSHGHADHVLGFPQLALLQKFITKDPPLRIYCTPPCAKQSARSPS